MCVYIYLSRYSGDCRPSEDLAKAGENATLLIHEATLEDTMEKDAKEKSHCTTQEAIDVGIKYNKNKKKGVLNVFF